jgi:hypothetical protein
MASHQNDAHNHFIIYYLAKLNKTNTSINPKPTS